MNIYLKHWKTTSAGIVTCVGAIVLYYNDPTRKIAPPLTAFLTGVGLFFASDVSQTTAKNSNQNGQ